MTYIVKQESSRHAVVYEVAEPHNRWIATVNTEGAPGRAAAVLKVIEDMAASANTTKEK